MPLNHFLLLTLYFLLCTFYFFFIYLFFALRFTLTVLTGSLDGNDG